MLKLGILRSPDGHSLSSVMQTAALKYLNIEGEYKSYGVSPEKLEKEFYKLKKEGITGLNVTMPHKIKIIQYLNELTDRAKLIGAVNTIIIKNGKSIGDNTDVIGFWESIPEYIKKEITTKTISILGTGGAAYACAMAFLQNGVNCLKIYGRNKKHLIIIQENLQSNTDIDIAINIDLTSNIDLSNTDILVNTTPVGMYPNINETPIKIEDLRILPKDANVYDSIYNPIQTRLLKESRSLGLKTINGVDMLVRQGAASLNIWLEKEIAPIEIMRESVVEACRGMPLP